MRHPVSYQIFPIATNCSMHIQVSKMNETEVA